MNEMFIMEHKKGVGAKFPEDTDLTYYTSEMQVVNKVITDEYAAGELPDPLPKNLASLSPNPAPIAWDTKDPEAPFVSRWELYTVVPTEVPRPHGGHVMVTPEPVGGKIVVEIDSTEAKVATL